MHNKYIFSNVAGTFIFNEHFSVLDKKMFKNIEQYRERALVEGEFSKKYSGLKKPEGKELDKVLLFFKNKEFFDEFYLKNIMITRRDVKASVKDDLLIIQTINNIDEVNKSISLNIRRLREWYAYYNPEFEDFVEDQKKFVELVLGKSKQELLKEIKVSEEESMGAELSKEDVEHILNLAKEVDNLYLLREKQEEYLERMMKKVCPNMLAITGAVIGAKLIAQSGSLRKLMDFPASTIQLLGAEKALFRHMKTGARPPRFGFLHDHPLINHSPRQKQGKIARALADKIAIAVKVDYFKGELIGDKLIKELEEKFR
ncbi:MAG: hypothetical protein KKC75_07570 [Nanoarchaeota archaeon]|nr:hypothetical protein [Nanoarchaeota archaeon]MBU1004315.1 hypothetical protein [Nanoarchaeota archaeon]MBU1945467.1 hypothetical protein [Nanoarchaeota archaeon]